MAATLTSFSINSYAVDSSASEVGVTNGAYHPDMSRATDSDGHYIMTQCSPALSPKSPRSEHTDIHSPLSRSSSSQASSTYRVEIADIDGEESSINLTTTHLKRCKRQVLRPYWRLLMFIGWRGFGREYVNSNSWGWKCLNTIYPLFIILLLFYTYGYEIVACQWKLNVMQDTQAQPTTPTTTHAPTKEPHNVTEGFNSFTLQPAFIVSTSQNLSQVHTAYSVACEHVFTTYVVPNVLHLVSYIMGFVHFRLHENEQLYALMECVFLQANPNYSRSASQQKMIRNMRLFFLFGSLWILSTLGMQALYEWAFDFPKLAFFLTTGPTVHWFLFAIDLYGILVINSIFVAVVTNYYTQCEMILFYVKGVTLRLQEKSTDLKTAMKDILSVRQNLSVLNGPIAKMTALVSVIFAELSIIGVCILVLNQVTLYKVWLYRSLFPVIWVTMLIIPLMQAARVNSVCNRFSKIALEIRVFGYKAASLLELDSFLNYVGKARLRAKLFHIPILASYLIALLVLALFVLLILLQTSVIGYNDRFF